MAPDIEAGFKSRRVHLRHLALVFQVEIRLRITAECFLRARSPKDFLEEFGGGTIQRISQHFEFLEAHGWLVEVADKGEAPKRRPGHQEKLYRAPEPPFFDAQTWALLPYSLRLAYSWSSFKATISDLRQAIEADVPHLGRRELTCTVLELDDLGWDRVIRQLDNGFEEVFKEQANAKIRDALGLGELFRIGVLQVGFELADNDGGPAAPLADDEAEPAIPFPERMAPIFANDDYMTILDEANKADITIKRFHEEFASDVSVGVVRRRFERLRNLHWIAVVDKIKRRAAHENVWRATKPALVNQDPQANVPDALVNTPTWKTFDQFSSLAKKAIATGSFDIRDDRHLAWCIIELDRRGLQKVIADMERLHALIDMEEAWAKKRIAAGATSLQMSVALAIQGLPVATKSP